MIYIITLLTGFFLNDSKLMNKVFGVRMEYIKYRLMLNELGIVILCFCLALNYFKGFFIIHFMNRGEISTFFLSLILLCGNILGARPSRTGGSEIFILCGALGGFNYSLIQIPIAIFLGCFLLTRKMKTSLIIAVIFCLSNLVINKYYFMFLLTFLVLTNFLKEGQSHFKCLFNTIKSRFTIVETKG